MSLFLNTNVASINSQRHFNNVTQKLNSTIEKLSSGMKINRAADGAGTLLLAEQLNSETRGYAVAANNIQQGINVLNIADQALQTINGDIQRLREIALEAANGTVTDFTAHSEEVAQIFTNIDAVANGTTYGQNGANVLLAGAITLEIQAGSGTAATDVIDIGASLSDNTAATLGLTQNSIASNADATALLGEVDTALANLATNVATVGGMQAQLENRLEFVQIARENYAASEAVVRNVDVAEETANLTKLQILQQASAMALAQANQLPNVAFKFLQ